MSQIRSGCRLEEENLYLPRSDPQFLARRACVLVTAMRADLFMKQVFLNLFIFNESHC